MKKFGLALALGLILLTAFSPLSCLAESEDLLYMINVYKGDAILIRASGKYYLIDTGKAEHWDKVEAALDDFGVSELEGVFLTHTDKDHCGGLKKLAKSGVKVNHWYASAFYDCEYDKHPMVKALKKTDEKIIFLKAGDSVDGLFTVLAPERLENDEDDNSLVMMFDNGACRALLTGDMEKNEERSLMASGAALNCDVLKVPNHADDDVLKHIELDALGARVALISTDPYDKPGTPDPLLTEALEAAGMVVYRTDLSELGILVTLDGECAVRVN